MLIMKASVIFLNCLLGRRYFKGITPSIHKKKTLQEKYRFHYIYEKTKNQRD